MKNTRKIVTFFAFTVAVVALYLNLVGHNVVTHIATIVALSVLGLWGAWMAFLKADTCFKARAMAKEQEEAEAARAEEDRMAAIIAAAVEKALADKATT